MLSKLMKNLMNNIRCHKIMREYQLECQRNSLKPSYNQLESYYEGNRIVVGCSCGKAVDTKVWDDDLGWYHFVECKKCGYYWEGPINCG